MRASLLLGFIFLFCSGELLAQYNCQNLTNNLRANGRIEIRVVLGYKDTRPSRFVGDRHERIQIVQELTQDCHPKLSSLCGFERDPSNADYFFKKIRHKGEKKGQIDLFLVHSSVGTDDQGNRENEFQSWQSAYAQKAFRDGLRSADIVLYNGHSRFGGGPDFSPPKIRSNKSIDLGYYKRSKPGLKLLLEDGHEMKASVLGLYSCEASSHFAQRVSQRLGANVIASKTIIHHAQAMKDLLSDLTEMLSPGCLMQRPLAQNN